MDARHQNAGSLIVCCLLIIGMLTSCSDSSELSSSPGSATFSINFIDSGEILSNDISVRAANIDCAGLGIRMIDVYVYDGTDTRLAGGQFACDAGTGTVDGIKSGSDRKFVIYGSNVNGYPLYRGEATGITIRDGQNTDVGTIDATQFFPQNVTLRPAENQVAITWDRVAFASSYSVYWSVTAGSSGVQSQARVDNIANTAYLHTKLSNDTAYSYLITATDAMGQESAISAEVSAMPREATAVPNAPTNLVAVPGNQQVTISWDHVDDAASYRCYMGTSPGVTQSANSADDETPFNAYTWTGLSNDTTYYFVVTAANSMGESEASNEASVNTEASDNNPPVLANGDVTPESGTSFESVSFCVDYQDPDGDNPVNKYVYIDDTAYTMNLVSGSFSNGEYCYHTYLLAGDYSYHFEFSDGEGNVSRLPENGEHSGPNISAAVITISGVMLNDGAPVSNLRMELGTENESLYVDTDENGRFTFTFDFNPHAEYLYILNDIYINDISENTFSRWHYDLPNIASTDITLPDLDIKFNNLFSPPSNTVVAANEISSSTPITFQWTDGGRDDIFSWQLQLSGRNNGNHHSWSTQYMSPDTTSVQFDGILHDSDRIPPGNYEWELYVTLGEEGGWSCSSVVIPLILE